MNRSVLIVDDEPSICKALQRTLKRNRITVYQANGGDEALKLLATTSVDCIISDQRMPGMKGTEFLGIAREQFPNTSRIISKPWDDNQLLDAVNEAIAPETFEPKLHLVAKAPQASRKQAPSAQLPADISQLQALEKAIKNDELELIVDDYLSMTYQHQSMLSLRIQWPEQAALSQDDIVSMAYAAGFTKTLMTWYLLQVLSYSGLSQQTPILIVKLFDVTALASQSLRKILSLALQPEQKLLFKIDLPAFQQGLQDEYLMPFIKDRHQQCGLLVDIGERVMNVDDLCDQSVQYIAMSGDEQILNNEILSYQRQQLIEKAAKFSIKTILLHGSMRSQRHYATRMNFDFIRAPE